MVTDGEVKREALTERMRSARSKAVVALQGYNTLRSKHPSAVVVAVEGDDDPIYYKTTIRAIDPTFEWIPLVCNGKDKVLALRVLLERNTDTDASKTFYIVDKDFDHLKGHPDGPNIYCTPGYSIENALVTKEAFEELLLGEFKCSTTDDDFEDLRSWFDARLTEFFAAMALANRALHHCRVKGYRSDSVDSRIKQYLAITLDGVTAKYDQNDLERLVGFVGTNITGLGETEAAFNALDPMNDWRGKYILSFFVELLSQLQEDRCSKSPKKFEVRKKVTFNPKSSIVRVLSSMVAPPPCLNDFVRHIAA